MPVCKWVKQLIHELHLKLLLKKKKTLGSSGGLAVKNSPCNTGTPVQSLVQGRSHVLWSNEACEPQLLTQHTAATKACVQRPCAPQQERPRDVRPHPAHQETKPTRSNKNPP